MSHELEIIDGRAQFLGREDAWHRLGEAMGHDFSWDDVEERLPGLTLPITKVPLKELLSPSYYIGPQALTVPDDLHLTIREDGKVLGQVGARYTVIQAREQYELGEALQVVGDDKGVMLETAGSLREGRQFFFTYSLGAMDINGEVVTNRVSTVGSHDGSLSNQVIRSNTVVVCANTLAMALAGFTHRFTFRHTRNYADKLEEARRVLELAEAANAQLGVVIQVLQATPVDTRKFDLFTDSLFPTQDVAAKTLNEHERAKAAVRELFTSPLTDGFENTGWAFVQAVNSYEQWNAPIRNAKGVASDTTRALRQFDSMVEGKQPLTNEAAKLVAASV